MQYFLLLSHSQTGPINRVTRNTWLAKTSRCWIGNVDQLKLTVYNRHISIQSRKITTHVQKWIRLKRFEIERKVTSSGRVSIIVRASLSSIYSVYEKRLSFCNWTKKLLACWEEEFLPFNFSFVRKHLPTRASRVGNNVLRPLSGSKLNDTLKEKNNQVLNAVKTMVSILFFSFSQPCTELRTKTLC